MMDSEYVPIITPPLVGTTNNGLIRIHVSREVKYDFVFMTQTPYQGTAYLMQHKGVTPGSQVEIRPTLENSVEVSVRLLDRFSQPTSGFIELNFQDFNTPNAGFDSPIHFSISSALRIVATPGLMTMQVTLTTGGWRYQFLGSEHDLKAGSAIASTFGGALNPKLRVLRPDWASPWTQLWFDVRDNFGNILSFYHDSTGQCRIPIILRSGGVPVYEGDQCDRGAWVSLLNHGIRRTFNPDTTYEMTLDFGPFGTAKLEGALFSEETQMRRERLTTEHFTVYYPEGYTEAQTNVARVLEAGYKAMQESTSLDLGASIETTFYIRGDWAGVSYCKGTLYTIEEAIRFPLRIPSISIRIFFHELGNVMQSCTPRGAFDVLNPRESFASALGTEAAARVYGVRFGQYIQGVEVRFLFDAIARGETLSIEGGGLRLVHAYLVSKFGIDVYRQFVNAWSSETVAKDLLLKSGYDPNETMAILLSYFSKENLAKLFQFAGLPIDEKRMESGYQIIAASNVD